MRIAFAGTPEFALPALTALAIHHQIVGVLTQPDRKAGRGQKLAPSAVKQAAAARELPLAQPATLKSEAARSLLARWDPQLLVVVAYGLILPPDILALPPHGCINIHASLLPRWRGAAPIERAILAGDRETGVTIMQMDSGLDTGPLLLQRPVPIAESDTGGSLREKLATLGAALLLEAIEGLAAGTLHARPQPQSGVTHAAKISKAEARIDWARDAIDIEREIRAFNPWPIAVTALAAEPLRILAGRAEPGSPERASPPGCIVSVDADSMLVACGRGALRVSEVQRPGRRVLSVRDYSHSVALLGRQLG
ncbi:MAG TPA: methionyl-tRNA formyltransferase [Steroidobacteraceae bacterium]|nr:methionyl-tRNA formyltransferase [Steroidobacteraceae bacterium]